MCTPAVCASTGRALEPNAEFGYRAILDPIRKRPGQRRGLFMDFLLHVVTVVPQLHRIGGLLAFADWALNFPPAGLEDSHRAPPDHGDIPFFEELKPRGHRQERGHIRRHQVAVAAQAHHHRGADAGGDQCIRLRVAEHDHGSISALQLLYRAADRKAQVAGSCQVIVDAMNDDLGIGFGLEPVPVGLELPTRSAS